MAFRAIFAMIQGILANVIRGAGTTYGIFFTVVHKDIHAL